MNIIETSDLCKNYGNDVGIKNINLEIKEGEIFGFIGPNGAGKSTFIRTLLGLLHPSSGTAKVLGYNINNKSEEIRKKLGYLPSEVNYYDGMSSRELLEYHSGFYDNVDMKKIRTLSEIFELDLDRKIEELSFGNKKKCAIIQSVIHEPDLLILDEPTSGLDPLMQNRFFELLEEENKKGTTIFFSSHILAEVQRLCNRAAVIRKGEISAVEDILSLLEKQMKKARFVFKEKKELTFISGVQNPTWTNNKLTFDYIGPVKELIQWMNQLELQDAVLEEPDLETIFMNYYQ
ncbi:MAG: ABC transporter ATP-binding protein [Flavobacteriales bacterium]|nr:MAG: ABC transporter ATP-binding protein [Flavobacteriales bacterium]